MNEYILGFGLFMVAYYGPAVLQATVHNGEPSGCTRFMFGLGASAVVGWFLI